MVSEELRMSYRLKIAVWSSSKAVPALAVVLALTGSGGCAPQRAGGETESVTGAVTASPKVDILFMVDDSASMTSMQQKMLQQIPTFIQSLQALPQGLPDLHLAVVSSDLGAPSDVGAAGLRCSQTGGDNGNFFNAPEGTCTATTLQAGATFITDNASGTTKNFTLADPAGLAAVFQCIALLGSDGCGFEHQLASVARALGADGHAAPAQNVGFLRDDALLAIVLLTNEDDCSAPASGAPLPVYSLNGDTVNDINTPASVGGPAEGPLSDYRCNGGPLGGHLCADPTSSTPTTLQQPPLNPPSDATGNPPTLTLASCESNDTASSALTPVSALIAGIKALKADPSNDIVVSAITAPVAPYIVDWFAGVGAASNQLWPQVGHSCFNANDQSFGDPSVRIAQFVRAFGNNGVTGSICDDSYSSAFQLIVDRIGTLQSGTGTGAGGGSGNGGAAGRSGAGGTAGTGSGGTHAGTGGHAGASPDGGSQDSGETFGKGSGCDCRTAGSPTSAWWSLTALLALCLARRARPRS